jgi:CRP-like cAMP-binding protein
MASKDVDPFGRLIRKLERLSTLDDADRDAIRRMPFRTRALPPHAYLLRERDVPTECGLLIEGYACRSTMLRDGARQIVSFHLPGDMLDLQQLMLHAADHDLQTITPAVVAWVPADSLRVLIRDHAAVGRALWHDCLIDAAILREWVLNLGRRDAKARIAHLLCEFVTRIESVGLGIPQSFPLPMTQEVVADATGLTPIHVNRMMSAMRADGLLARNGRELRIADWAGLRAVADFDPAYLHEVG